MSFLSFFGHFLHHNMVNYIVIILPGQGFISGPQGFLPNYIILAGLIILFTQGFFVLAFCSATPICQASTCATSTDLNCKPWCLHTIPKPARNAHHHWQFVQIRRTYPVFQKVSIFLLKSLECLRRRIWRIWRI